MLTNIDGAPLPGNDSLYAFMDRVAVIYWNILAPTVNDL